MKRIAAARRAFSTRHVQWALGSRITVAAVTTLIVGHLLGTPMVLWAVLTAVILTQMSVGRSVKATIDYALGTVGGAIYAGLVSALLPPHGEAALVASLALGIAPLAMLAAFSPRFSVAPSTGVLVVLAPTLTHATAFHSAYDRVLEVALGGAVALVVSHLVFPARARVLARQAAADMLDTIAETLPPLFAGLRDGQESETIRALQRGVGAAFSRVDRIEQEARHERIAILRAEPDLAPLLQALLRMRHDLVMIGRAALSPLPPEFGERLGPALDAIALRAGERARDLARALRTNRAVDHSAQLDAAFDAYAQEIASLRRDGRLRSLSVEELEHVFALGFAFEQWREDFAELARRIGDGPR
ncbi:aromatic acid exporter family protein [Methylosinus sp. Sm6]|uniref:FUSC family protein n=1 Tax=Methylosinus sp. Sm6 TaxID=2866948 RepID=UPI001C991AF0|nr:FUSC family protein [Methylosinus sp. Sm6]MBY6241661.1 FUSC family protein [Methylosinus sp. Sm6]